MPDPIESAEPTDPTDPTDPARAFEIALDEEKCAGCLMCQMRCSYRFTGTFNLSRSAICIFREPKGKREFHVRFTDNCDKCGVCVRHCTYGALTKKTKKTKKMTGSETRGTGGREGQ